VHLVFLTPLASVLALGCVVPLLALYLVRALGRRTRAVIGLPDPWARSYVGPVAAIVLVGCLLGLAASQPVLEFRETVRVRTDAEAIFVLDTSKSMLARKGPGAATRLERAKEDALRLRTELPTIPVGLASVTDRTLPYLFPSSNENVFRTTLAQSVGIERPPPVEQLLSRVTRLDTLGAVATQGFFSPTARKRLLVVLTDGESLPQTNPHLTSIFRRPPGIETTFVQVWRPDERLFAGRLPNPAYRSDPTARTTLDRFASLLGAKVFSESQIGAAAQVVRGLAGSGPTVDRGDRLRHIAFAPFLAAAAFLPLALLLWRRDR
jgi:hypothetical protein